MYDITVQAFAAGPLLGRTFTIKCVDASHFFRFEESIYSGAAAIGGEGKVMEERNDENDETAQESHMDGRKEDIRACGVGRAWRVKMGKRERGKKRGAQQKFTVVEAGHDVE